MQKEPLPTSVAEALKVFTFLFVTADISLQLFSLLCLRGKLVAWVDATVGPRRNRR